MSERSTTVDQKEVSKFASFAKDFFWKSREGTALRSMNELRIPLIRDSVRPVTRTGDKFRRTVHPLAGVRILDIGSGGGLVAEPLARLGAQVTGIDPVKENVDTASNHLEEMSRDLSDNLKYLQSSVEDFASDPHNKNAFHAVVSSEVLEHVDDVKLFLHSVHALLQPGGRLIITTINQTLAAQLLAITLAENVLNLLPKGTHSYKKLVPRQGLQHLVEETGFSIQSVNGMVYNPFTDVWSWSRMTSINYAVVAVKRE